MKYTLEGIAKEKPIFKKFVLAVAVSAVTAGGLFASVFAAGITYVTPIITQGWAESDIRNSGMATISHDKADRTGGAASLKLYLTNASDKAGYKVLGDFGPVSNITDLSFDWYRDQSSSAQSHLTPAFGVYVADNAGNSWLLKWEGVYNNYPQANGPVPVDQWVTENISSGKFWRIPQTKNGVWVGFSGCNLPGDPYECFTFSRTLQDSWLAGYNIVGIDVSVGSGWSGGYLSYIDNVKVNAKTYNFELVAPDTQAPSVPQNLGWQSPAVACGGYTASYAITARWDAATDNVATVGYEYSVMTPPRTTWTSAWTTAVSGTSYSGAFTEGVGTYTFRVRAYDAVGNYSDWSNSCSVTYKPVPKNKDMCKLEGWKILFTADGLSFKNQGACVSYVQANDNASFKRQ